MNAIEIKCVLLTHDEQNIANRINNIESIAER